MLRGRSDTAGLCDLDFGWKGISKGHIGTGSVRVASPLRFDMAS